MLNGVVVGHTVSMKDVFTQVREGASLFFAQVLTRSPPTTSVSDGDVYSFVMRLTVTFSIVL